MQPAEDAVNLHSDFLLCERLQPHHFIAAGTRKSGKPFLTCMAFLRCLFAAGKKDVHDPCPCVAKQVREQLEAEPIGIMEVVKYEHSRPVAENAQKHRYNRLEG